LAGRASSRAVRSRNLQVAPDASRLQSQPSVCVRRDLKVAATGLRFLSHRLLSLNADLRIPLRKVRTRQRNPGSLYGLEGHSLPALRLGEIGQEVFSLRPGQRRSRQRGIGKRRRWRLLRRPLPRTLNCSRKLQFAFTLEGRGYPHTSRAVTRVKSSTAQSG